MKNARGLIIVTVVFATVITVAAVMYPRLADAYFAEERHLQESISESPSESSSQTVIESVSEKESESTVMKNTAPDFAVRNGEGNTEKLSEHFGRPVVVNFFATWCPSCVSELPTFHKLYKEYGDKIDFMIIDLCDGYRDTVASATKYTADNGYTFPLYFDETYEASDAYGVYYIPETVFIDENGNALETKVGALSENVLRAYLDSLLGE